MLSSARSALPYAVWLSTILLWGTTWAVIRVGLRDLPPLTFCAARTSLAAVVMLAIAQAAAPHRRPAAREASYWAAVGVPQLGLTYALIFWAEQTISSGLTATLFATFPAFAAVAAHLLLPDEPLSWRRFGGTALAFVAVMVLVGPTRGEGAALLPSLAVVTAACSGAVAAVLVRRHGRATSTLWLTAIQIASAAVFLTGLAVLLEAGAERTLTWRAAFAVAYLGIAVTAVCYLGLFWLLKRLDATFVSMGVVGETTVAVFLGAGLLGEALGAQAFAGLGLVAISIIVVSLRDEHVGRIRRGVAPWSST